MNLVHAPNRLEESAEAVPRADQREIDDASVYIHRWKLREPIVLDRVVLRRRHHSDIHSDPILPEIEHSSANVARNFDNLRERA